MLHGTRLYKLVYDSDGNGQLLKVFSDQEIKGNIEKLKTSE